MDKEQGISRREAGKKIWRKVAEKMFVVTDKTVDKVREALENFWIPEKKELERIMAEPIEPKFETEKEKLEKLASIKALEIIAAARPFRKEQELRAEMSLVEALTLPLTPEEKNGLLEAAMTRLEGVVGEKLRPEFKELVKKELLGREGTKVEE